MEFKDFKDMNDMIHVRINDQAQYDWQIGETGVAVLCSSSCEEMRRGSRDISEVTAMVTLDKPHGTTHRVELYLFKLDKIKRPEKPSVQLELFS